MANKRDLKKQIHYVCGELALTCIFTRDCIPGVNRKEIDDLIVEVATLQSNALEHLDFSFDKARKDFPNPADFNKAKAAYERKAYKSFTDEFNAKIAEIVKSLNTHLTAEQRELNKKAVAE